jgi:signal transduction histidine kinase
MAVRRASWVAVAATLAVVAGVAALASQAARRDRTALLAAFGEEHLSRLRVAIREIESELADVGKDLAFASRLVEAAESGADQRRELEALLAVVRAYRMVSVFDGAGARRLVVLDPLAPSSWSGAPFEPVLAETARAATSRASMAVSLPIGDPGSLWYRAFATPLSRDGRIRGAVVILVDLERSFERLRLAAPDPSTKLVLLGPHGHPAPLSDPSLAKLATSGEPPGPLAAILESMRAGRSGRSLVPEPVAERLGLGEADAVAVFAPSQAGDAGHWSVAMVSSTAMLRSQERAIILQMGLLGAVFAVALGGLSAYLVVSARRAIAVREQLRTAEQVAHLREKAEKILENVPVGVLALDEEGCIAAMNRASRERVPSAVQGSPVDVAFPKAPPGALEALRALVAEARSSGKVQRIVAEPLALLGRESYFAVHAVPLDHPLRDVKLLLVLEDVTELRALSSQLLRAEKLATVGVLAAGIAHEVGTPLGVVRGRGEMLVSKLGPGHPQTHSASIIVEEIDRISRVIRELLDFSRVSRAAGVSVPLEAVARNVAELLAFEARTRKVSVEVDVDAGLPPVAADPDQLKQVLVNLTLNALHACSPGGHVTVRALADSESARARIEVLDDGAGVPEALRHRVFDPFFTTKKRGKGTGLGLTVAEQIVRNHGGEIDLDSAEGKGTRVVVRWPLAASGTEETDGQAEGRARSRGR